MRISPEARPVTFFLDLLVGDGALDNENKWIEPARLCLIPELHEIVAVFIGKDRIVQVNLGKPGNCAEDDIFDARLRGCSDGDGVSIATQPRRYPQNMEFGYGRFPLRDSTIRNSLCGHNRGSPPGGVGSSCLVQLQRKAERAKKRRNTPVRTWKRRRERARRSQHRAGDEQKSRQDSRYCGLPVWSRPL